MNPTRVVFPSVRIHSLPLREFWGCDGRRGFAQEIFVVIRAYIDESIGKYKTFALGCAIAKGTEWTWVNRDWKKCIERKNRELKGAGRHCISRYHASDCESMLGEFQGWDIPEKQAFIAELLEIINKYHIHVVSSTLHKTDLLEVYPEIKEDDADKESYAGLAWLLFPEIVKEAHLLDAHPAVKLVYERGKVTQHMDRTYERWCAANFREAEIFDSIEKDSWKVLPLQVADLIAFEAMKDRDNTIRSDQTGPSLPAQRITRR